MKYILGFGIIFYEVIPKMKGVKISCLIILAVLILLPIIFGVQGLKPAAVVLLEGAERVRLQGLTVGYSVKETEDFVIRFPSEDIDVVHRVEGEAKRQLKLVTEYFGYKPEKQIYLTVYHDNEHLQKGLRLPREGTTLGAYYAGTINILSPKAWGVEGSEAEKGLYIHEFTHLIMADMARGNYPVWFTEGMALYQEFINTGFEWGKDYVFHRFPYSLEELSDNFPSLDQYLAYKQSFLLVKEIMEAEGKDKVLELFAVLSDNTPFDRAFPQVFGYSLEDLYGYTEQCFKK